MKDIPLKDRIKKMRKFIQDNNLSDKKTFQSTDIPKDKNGFIDFNKIKL
jgi:hypothetical protein|tara:strand:+ start:186 stop:332 length:147 start_codon:yes stop_codon:yes gene_type:complete